MSGIDFSGYTSIRMLCPRAVECVDLDLGNFDVMNQSWAAGQLSSFLFLAQLEEEFVSTSASVSMCAVGDSKEECRRYCNQTCIRQDRVSNISFEQKFAFTLSQDVVSYDNGSNRHNLTAPRYYCPRGSGLRPSPASYPRWAYDIYGWPRAIACLCLTYNDQILTLSSSAYRPGRRAFRAACLRTRPGPCACSRRLGASCSG